MSKLFQHIDDEIKRLAKEKNFVAKTTYVTLKAEIQAEAVDKQRKRIDPTDDHVIVVAKRFKEKALETRNATTDAIALREIDEEIAVYTQFLPAEITAEQVNAWLSVNGTSAKNAGMLTGLLVKQFGKGLDGKLAKKLAEDFINGNV